MANLIDADLLLDTLSNRAITTLGNRLAPLAAFSRNFSTDEMARQTKYVQVPIVTATSAIQTNPTDFETGDTNTSNVGVQVNHISKSFYLSTVEINQKLQLEMMLDKNLQTISNELIDIALTPITNTNFTTQNIIVAAASIAAANLQTVWAGVAKNATKSVILDATAYSKLIPTALTAVDIRTSGAFGFDQFLLNTRWSDAGANVYGFACGPGAVAIVAGIPIKGAGGSSLVGSRTITLPDLGLPVEINTWYSSKSRSQWVSIDVMFGAAFGGDLNSGFIIRSAAE